MTSFHMTCRVELRFTLALSFNKNSEVHCELTLTLHASYVSPSSLLAPLILSVPFGCFTADRDGE